MKSYNHHTSGGDGGDTSRLGGQRVRKNHPLVAANGDIDELNAHLGLCLAGTGTQTDTVAEALARVQTDLLTVGAMIASESPPPITIGDEDIARLEREIAHVNEQLPPLDKLIIPGGTELARRLHVARCVCRRAERAMVTAADANLTVSPKARVYLNRLSDLLFELARLANHAAGRQEQTWSP